MESNNRSIQSGILTILIAISAFSATYYVAPNGTGTGSFASPLGSITSFHAVAVAGDTCYVRGGTHTPSATIVLTKDGVENDPICLFAYPGETPVIDGRNAADDAAIKFNGTDWWHIKGIQVTNTRTAWISGITVKGTSTHLVFEMITTHHCAFVGLMLNGVVSDILILNCDAHHNADVAQGNADGFQIYPTSSARVIYRGCRSWNNSDDGWDFYFATARSVLMENCWAFKNGLDDAGTTLGDGNGFKLGGPLADSRVSSSGGHKLIRCLAFGNGYCGFNENSDAGGLGDTLYNNTGYANDGWRDFDFDAGPAHVLRNNSSIGGNGAATGRSVVDHNTWNPGVSATTADFLSISDLGTMGPRKANGDPPDLDFLKLAGGSDLIDAGVNVGLPFSGNAPDLGAYEYGRTTGVRGGVRMKEHSNPSFIHKPGDGMLFDIHGRVACRGAAGALVMRSFTGNLLIRIGQNRVDRP